MNAVLLILAIVGWLVFLVLARVSKQGKIPSNSEKIKNAKDCFDQGRFSDAANAWTDVLHEFEKTGNIPGIVGTTVMIGYCYVTLGDYEEAAHAFKSVTTIGYQEEFGAALFSAFQHLGVCYVKLGQIAPALETIDQVAQIFGDEKVILASAALANALRNKGNSDEAIETFKKALSLCGQQDSFHGCPEALHDYSLLLRTMGRNREAIGHLREAAQISLRGKNLSLQAHQFCTLSFFLCSVGDMEEAEQTSAQALQLATASENPYYVAYARHVAACIAWASGQRSKAASLLEDAQAVLRDQDKDMRIIVLLTIADHAQEAGDFDRASVLLAEAEHDAVNTDRQEQERLLRIRMELMVKSRKLDEARNLLYSVQQSSPAIPYYDASREKIAGMIAAGQQRYADALHHLKKALEFFEKADLKIATASICKYLALTYRGMGDDVRSNEHRQQAHSIFMSLGDQASADEIANM